MKENCPNRANSLSSLVNRFTWRFRRPKANQPVDSRFSSELMTILLAAGWFPGRSTDIELEKLTFPMHSPGTQFLSEFGGLLIGSWIHPSAHEANYSRQHISRIADANLPECLPVASSWFWCEGELWMDRRGWVYQADDYQLVLVSENIAEALEKLLVFKKIAPDSLKWAIKPRPGNPFDHGVLAK